jgi:hypothetical protein
MFSVIYDETGCPFQPKNYFKISLKIKIFLWLIQLGVILTKDDLVKRKWKGKKNVASVIVMRQSSTYFFIVTMEKLFGGLFMLPRG